MFFYESVWIWSIGSDGGINEILSREGEIYDGILGLHAVVSGERDI